MDGRLATYQAIPAPWRRLYFEINGGRIPDGEPGIRDVDAPCEVFAPVGKSFEFADGSGSCDTDGHYLCTECKHISLPVLRRRRDQCEECGAKLARERGEFGPEVVCSAHCDQPREVQ